MGWLFPDSDTDAVADDDASLVDEKEVTRGGADEGEDDGEDDNQYDDEDDYHDDDDDQDDDDQDDVVVNDALEGNADAEDNDDADDNEEDDNSDSDVIPYIAYRSNPSGQTLSMHPGVLVDVTFLSLDDLRYVTNGGHQSPTFVQQITF